MLFHPRNEFGKPVTVSVPNVKTDWTVVIDRTDMKLTFQPLKHGTKDITLFYEEKGDFDRDEIALMKELGSQTITG